jgi:hypothetical protein
MKLQSLPYTIIVFLLCMVMTSCVSNKKYIAARKTISEKDSLLLSERKKMSSLNDSLRLALLSKDTIIDSLNVRLAEATTKKEKEKVKVTNISAKKSTLTKEQEYEKKSLFLYNFTKLVEWPIEYNGTEFVIGVVSDDICLREIQDFMAQKKVSGKKIIVEKYKKGARYNVVYITSAESGSFSTVKNAVKKNKTLLVTDDATAGSHISFILDQDKVRYLVNKIAIEKAGLKVGQELMRYSG